MKLWFRPSSRRRWTTAAMGDCTAHATGWAWQGRRLLNGEGLAAAFAESWTGATEAAHGVAGHFAAVIEGPQGVGAVVDGVRSIPLFACAGDGVLSVSDEAGLVDPGGPLDPGAVLEYAAAGFVSGARTLRPGIEALPAGQLATWPWEGGPATRWRHTRYQCTYDRKAPVQDQVAALDEAVSAAFRRALGGLQDRQVVVPLSGGLDSRLVASTLRRLGHSRVLCISYGLPGNWESRRSAAVAKRLGFLWAFVPYSGDAWRAAFRDPGTRRLHDYASNLTSLPLLNEWPALRALRDDPRVEPDAVFMPGHTGDFLCGGHLKYLLDPAWNPDPEDFAGAVLRKHFGLWADILEAPVARAHFAARVEDLVGRPGPRPEDRAAAYEAFEWQERQAKFIINAVRLYEFHGYDWRLPLWDRGLMDFWAGVPLGLKMGKFLYRTYLAQRDPFGVFADAAATGRWAPGPPRRHPPVGSLRWRAGQLRRHAADYGRHPLGLARPHGLLRYLLRESGKRHTDALLSAEVLRTLHGVDPAAVRRIAAGA